MNCPQCPTPATVYDTRITAKGIRRRYKCANGHRFTTLETVIPAGPSATENLKPKKASPHAMLTAALTRQITYLYDEP